MSRLDEPVKVNKILSRKASIAGIPGDVFVVAMSLDLFLYFILCQIFLLDLMTFGLICFVVDGTWILLTLRGVWRFVGLAFRPPIYFRANLPYRSPLNSPDGFIHSQTPHRRSSK
jgi:hypothetical protein